MKSQSSKILFEYFLFFSDLIKSKNDWFRRKEMPHIHWPKPYLHNMSKAKSFFSQGLLRTAKI